MSKLNIFGKHGNTYTGIYSSGERSGATGTLSSEQLQSDSTDEDVQLYAPVPRDKVKQEIGRRLDIVDEVLSVMTADINDKIGPLKRYRNIKDATTFDSWDEVFARRRELDRDKWHQFLKTSADPYKVAAVLYPTGYNEVQREVFNRVLLPLVGPEGTQVKALLDFQNDIQEALKAKRGVPDGARITLPIGRTTGDRFGRYSTFAALVQLDYKPYYPRQNQLDPGMANAYLTVRKYNLGDEYVDPKGKHYNLLQEYLKDSIEENITKSSHYQRKLFL